MRTWISLILQGSASIPRPSGPPQAHAPGVNSDRILILGGGPASGWGVSSHDLALPGSLARALSARTGRGADVTLSADPYGYLVDIPNLLIGQDLSRIDAIVVFAGVNDAVNLTSERNWERSMGRLLRALERETLDTTYVYVMDIQPIRTIPTFDSVLGSIANRHARHLTRRTERLCRAVPQTVFLPLVDTAFLVSGRYRNSTDYRLWGEFLAGEMAERLHQAQTRLDRAGIRPAAIDAPGVETDDTNEPQIRDTRFDRVVALAQQSFGTESAVFVLHDHARLRVAASAGPTAGNLAWADSMSATVVLQPGALIVGDTQQDERFQDKSSVVGAPFMRFYAAFPIESPSGERIGALSVFDPKPRCIADINSVLLRELALMIQDELHASAGVFTDTT
ncbi:hypothetical protein QMK22_08530 [Cryobacterium sp. PH29-G1]|nr:hypothetical protein [Cryobacterium sp. PH29-G1]